MKPTLLVLAAGLGSRYGGLKQLEKFGPNGETLMEYSVLDAARAGFGKVVFVIRRDFAEEFKNNILSRFESMDIEVATAFQDRDDVPQHFKVPEARVKPWGTGHAVLAAREAISGPFCMVNADDFYGYESFAAMARFFAAGSKPGRYAMVGYRLKDTLSKYGQVTRALCETDSQGFLTGMREMAGIGRDAQGVLMGGGMALTGNEVVSMNCFGFEADVFGYLGEQFKLFLKEQGTDPKSEFLIPDVLGKAVKAGVAQLAVLEGSTEWFGVTYPQDAPRVKAEIAKLRREGASEAARS